MHRPRLGCPEILARGPFPEVSDRHNRVFSAYFVNSEPFRSSGVTDRGPLGRKQVHLRTRRRFDLSGQSCSVAPMKRIRSATFACSVTAFLSLFAGPSARADIPVGYKGKPFDPAVAGGPLCPPTVKAGPYAIPGRLDFVNYDLGGDGVAFHTGDHIVKGGTGYRVDTPPTATFSLTSACAPTCPNVWYDSGHGARRNRLSVQPTTGDFSIGAVQNNDYVNITVNVVTGREPYLAELDVGHRSNGPPRRRGGRRHDGARGLFERHTARYLDGCLPELQHRG